MASIEKVLAEAVGRVGVEGGPSREGRTPAAVSAKPPGRHLRRTAHSQDWSRFDEFLRELLRRQQLAWRGYRRKRKSLRQRFLSRMGELGLRSLNDYLSYLRGHPEEAPHLNEILAVTVSRFFRDRAEWQRLRMHFEELARGGEVRVWSVGCACGEEPYTLSLVWKTWAEEAETEAVLRIRATDISAPCLERARARTYERGALHSVPAPLLSRFFRESGEGRYELEAALAAEIEFERSDLYRDPWPDGPFDLILCRNLFFTYLDEPRRGETGRKLVHRLRSGGLLMVGSNDHLEGEALGLAHLEGVLWIRPARPTPP